MSCFFLVHSHLRSSIIFHSSILSCTISKLPAYVRILVFRCHAWLSVTSLFRLWIDNFCPARVILVSTKNLSLLDQNHQSFTADVSCATEMGYSLEQVRNNGVEDKKMRPFPVWMRPLPPNDRSLPVFPLEHRQLKINRK